MRVLPEKTQAECMRSATSADGRNPSPQINLIESSINLLISWFVGNVETLFVACSICFFFLAVCCKKFGLGRATQCPEIHVASAKQLVGSVLSVGCFNWFPAISANVRLGFSMW